MWRKQPGKPPDMNPIEISNGTQMGQSYLLYFSTLLPETSAVIIQPAKNIWTTRTNNNQNYLFFKKSLQTIRETKEVFKIHFRCITKFLFSQIYITFSRFSSVNILTLHWGPCFLNYYLIIFLQLNPKHV